MGLIGELVGKHCGSPIVVVGGGPSAPDQVARAPEGSIFISANEHGTYLGLHDYFVIVDDLRQKPEKLAKIKATGDPIIGRDWWVDYRLAPYQPVGNSGMQAAYVAMLLGGYPILLAGMDCYQGNTYFHTEREESTGHQKTDKYFEFAWKKTKEKLDRQRAVVRGMGGLTAELFGQYDPEEALPEYEVPRVHRVFLGLGNLEVEALRPCPIVGYLRKERAAPEGARFRVTSDELSRFSRAGEVRQIGV